MSATDEQKKLGDALDAAVAKLAPPLREPARELVRLSAHLADGHAAAHVRAALGGEAAAPFSEAADQLLALALRQVGAAADAWARLPAHSRAAQRAR